MSDTLAAPPAALETRYRTWRWQIFGITWITYASYYLIRKSFSVAKVAFESDSAIQFTKEQMGRIDATYLTIYSAGQFIAGPLADRFGPRRVILFGLALSILIGTLNGMVTLLAAFIALAAIQGIAQSSGWSPVVKNMSSWFSMRERGTVMGFWCTNFAVGGFIATIFAAEAVRFFTGTPLVNGIAAWRFAFFAPAAAVALVWLLFLLLQRDKPEDVGLPPIEAYQGEPEPVIEEGDRPADEPEGSWHVVAEVLRNPIVWVLAIGYFSLKLTRYAFLLWGPMLVKETLGSGVSQSAWTAAMFEVGGPLGVIAAGIVSDRLFAARRFPVAVVSLFVLAGLMLAANQLSLGTIGLGVFFFCAGFFLFGPDTIISGTAAMDFGTRKGAGTAAGLINGVGSVGAIFGGYLPGWLASDTTSRSGKLIGDWLRAALGTENDWAVAFYVFSAFIAATALLLLPLWNRRPATAAGDNAKAKA